MFGHRLALAAVLQLHIGQADGAQDGEARDSRQREPAHRTPRPVCADSLSCRSSSERAQRLAVGNDRGLRFTRGHQALQVAQDGAGLRAGLFVQSSAALPGARASAGPWMPARRSSGLPSSRPWAISLNEFKSLPSRNTASGLTPSMVRNSLADLPIRCVNITSWPAAEISAGGAFCCSFSDDTVSAISSRSDDWRLMVRSALPTCGQDLLLAHHGAGVLFGTLHQRERSCPRPAAARPPRGSQAQRCRRRSAGRARVLASVVGAFLHVGEGLRRCPPGPATPTWQGAATASATGRCPPPAGRPCRPAQREDGHRSQHQQREGQQAEQDPLVRADGSAPQHRHRDQLGFVGRHPAAATESSCATLSGSAGVVIAAPSPLAASRRWPSSHRATHRACRGSARRWSPRVDSTGFFANRFLIWATTDMVRPSGKLWNL